MIIIRIILLSLILYYVVKGIWKVYSIYKRIHDAAKQFQNTGNFGGNFGNGGFGSGNYGAGGFGTNNNGAGSQNAGSNNASSNSRSYSTTTPTGEVVEDRRTEDAINRKIFTQDEGEYITYIEEEEEE